MSVIAVASAAAKSNFGGWEYGNSNGPFYQYGGGVDIQVPRVGNHTVVAHEFELQRSVSQTSAGGLIQSALIRTGSDITIDNCGGSVNAYSYVAEWRDGSSAYTCLNIGAAPALEVDSFWVENQQQYGSGSWLFRANGTSVAMAGYRTIGSDTAFPYYGEELNNDIGTECLADSSSVAGFYGQSTGPGPFNGHWYVYFSPNGGDKAAIVNPNNVTRVEPTWNWDVPAVTSWPQTISNDSSTACNQG